MADADGTTKGTSKVLVVVLIGCLALVPILGVFAALAIYGVRKYLAEAKSAEGRTEVMALARGVLACQSDSGHLPASSKPVPAALGSVSGKKYQPAPGEYAGDVAFACAHFEMSYPQYFQYQWVLETPASGHAVALADLDGDGTAEIGFRVAVTCPAGGTCSMGSIESKH